MTQFDPAFNVIDTSRKTPSFQAEVNDTTALGLPSTRKKILLLAPKTAAGSATNAQLITGIADEATVSTYLGKVALEMVRFIFGANAAPDLDALAIAEAGGGTAAAGAFVFATNASADGTIRCWFGHRYVDVAVTSGDTPTEIGDALVAAMAAETDLPWTGENTTGSVAVTYAYKGTIGNHYRLARDMGDVTGTTCTVTQPTSGATDPTFDSTYTGVYVDRDYDLVICPWRFASTNLTNLKNAQIAMQAPARGNGAMHLIGITDTYSNAVAYQATVQRPDFIVLWRKSLTLWPVPPHCRAAYEAGVLSAEADPGAHFIREKRPLDFAPIETTSAQPTATEIENAMANGLSVDRTLPDGTTEIVQLITTATQLSGGAESDAWASPGVYLGLKYFRQSLINRLETAFATRSSRKMDANKIPVVKGVCLQVAYDLSDPNASFQVLSRAAVDATKSQWVVRQSSTNTKFIEIGIPAPVLPEFRGANATIYLTIPTVSE